MNMTLSFSHGIVIYKGNSYVCCARITFFKRYEEQIKPAVIFFPHCIYLFGVGCMRSASGAAGLMM